MRQFIEIGGRTREVVLEAVAGGIVAALDGRPVELDIVRVAPGRYSLRVPASGRQHDVIVSATTANQFEVTVDGVAIRAARSRAAGGTRRAASSTDGPSRVTAPMPGKVVRVLVAPGDEVGPRQGLVVVEAMKMENELRAGRRGRVRDVLVTEGASVESGALLVVLE